MKNQDTFFNRFQSNCKLYIKKVKDYLCKLKDKLWFKYILNGNEFHPSLNIDHKKMIGKSYEENLKYLHKIVQLREKAHQLEIENDKNKF